MNTPNKLTILRILLVPFFVAFLLLDQIPYHFLWALLVFAAAAVTDAIDGNMARKNNLVTDFGKFLDPLADKILVVAALICFVELKLASAVVVVIIISREFLVTSLRLVASGSGTVIAASIWGKLKTISQMVSVVVILRLSAGQEMFGIFASSTPIVVISQVLMWIAAAFTVVSGIDYMVKNWKYVDPMK